MCKKKQQQIYLFRNRIAIGSVCFATELLVAATVAVVLVGFAFIDEILFVLVDVRTVGSLEVVVTLLLEGNCRTTHIFRISFDAFFSSPFSFSTRVLLNDRLPRFTLLLGLSSPPPAEDVVDDNDDDVCELLKCTTFVDLIAVVGVSAATILPFNKSSFGLDKSADNRAADRLDNVAFVAAVGDGGVALLFVVVVVD